MTFSTLCDVTVQCYLPLCFYLSASGHERVVEDVSFLFFRPPPQEMNVEQLCRALGRSGDAVLLLAFRVVRRLATTAHGREAIQGSWNNKRDREGRERGWWWLEERIFPEGQ